MFSANATEQEIVSWVERKFEEAHSTRLTLERQWLLNLAFYYGKQWVTWGPTNVTVARLTEPPAPSWRVRLTVNKIEPYVRREMARLSSQKPRGFVMPASADEVDKSAARVAEQLAEYLHDNVGLDEAMELADWWTCIAGTSFVKVRFTEDYDFDNEMPGKIRVEALRPFDIYVANIEETRLAEQEWVMHVSSIPAEFIKATYGVDVKSDEQTSEVDQKVRNVMAIFNQGNSHNVIVKEVWIKPCRQFPDGLVVAVANQKLLPLKKIEEPQEPTPGQEGELAPDPETDSKTPQGTMEWPFDHKQYPFIRRGHTMSGKFYDSSFVTTIIPLQREYNRTRSQIIENKNITARPQWAIQAGSMDVRQLTTEPGAVMQYAPGATPPKPVEMQSLPGYVMDHVERTSMEMDELASQNEVSKGNVPPGVEAATAIAYLQERDDSAVSYAVRNRERAYQVATQQMLSLVQQYWDAQRIVRVVGENSSYDSFVLKGADLKENTDYRVVTGSGTPISRAAQKAEILELMKGGAIPATKGLKFLGMPDMEQLINEIEINEIQANKENLKLSRGMFVRVENWHDHVAHLDAHDDFKKREEYEILDPKYKAMIRLHDYMHLKMLATLFNALPMFPETPQDPNTMQINPMTGQPEPDPFYVDPAYELELRKTLMHLKAGVPPTPPPGPPGGSPPQ